MTPIALILGMANVTAEAVAQSSVEVAQIAISTTVRIDNYMNIPGGSGVIIARDNNVYSVLTANHVVENPNFGYFIHTSEGREYDLIEVQSFKNNLGRPDLALVTFESSQDYPVVSIAGDEQLPVGSDIYVSGYPLGIPALEECSNDNSSCNSSPERSHEFTSGIITGYQTNRPYGYSLRHQALTRRGMSGGPVLDASGRLVGIHGQGDTVARITNESSGLAEEVKTGFNAAIPITTFLNLGHQLNRSNSNLNIDDQPPPPPENPAARDNLIDGINFAEIGDWNSALTSFNNAIALDDGDPKIYYNQGVAYFMLGNFSEAVTAWTRTVELDGQNGDAYYGRGWAYYRLGQLEQALEDYIQANRLDPLNAVAYFQRGMIREDLGEPQMAINEYSEAIRVSPQYGKAYYNRGYLRYYEQDLEGAIADFEEAARLFQQEGQMDLYRETENVLRQIRL